MSKIIRRITKDQKNKIPQYIEKWVSIANKPIIKEEAIKRTKEIYKRIGEKEPIIIFGDSPLACVFMVGMIVGYVEGNKVFIGGDSAGVAGYSITYREDKKVFKKEDMIFGFTSSFRMGQIIRSCLRIPEQTSKQTDYDYLCSDFIDALIKCFEDKGYNKVKDGVKSGGFFLLGYRERLYYVENDYQVGMSLKKYEATGCGDHLALGALHALEKYKLSPKERITKALEAAAEFSAGVSPPFNIVEL